MQAQVAQPPYYNAVTEDGLMTPWTAFLSSTAGSYPFPAIAQAQPAQPDHQWASWSAPAAMPSEYPMYIAPDDVMASAYGNVKAEPMDAGSISPSLLFTASPATYLMPQMPSASTSDASLALKPLSRSWSNETPHLSSPSPSPSDSSHLPSPPSLPVSEPEHSDHEHDHEEDNEGIERDGKIWGMPTEQYRALSARERKRVRNRISARTFRAKRKGKLYSIQPQKPQSDTG